MISPILGLFLATACDMAKAATHEGERTTTIYATETGVAALYYAANMDVNTDGAAKSYHPDDPRGRTLAFNNVANAIWRIYDAEGADITCKPRKGACFARFIETFEAARDADYDPSGHPRFTSDGMIPWKRDDALGRQTPCRIESGPFEGYFITQTSLIADRSKPVCDQGRYLDSFAFNAVVVPKRADWRAQGVVTDDGDLVVVRDVDSRRIAYAVNGDRGPAKKIGEGSIALAAALSGATLTGEETYDDVKALARTRVEYVTFPKDDIRRHVGGPFTQADIDREGARLFAAWGGAERLDQCALLEEPAAGAPVTPSAPPSD